MKTKSLQFGKAMSAALFVLLLSMVGMKNALAQNQVATLQHGDSIRVFYGTYALAAAYNAADTCDIITLSDGTFTGVNITKAITIRGAGGVWDSVSASFPTIVSGDITLDMAYHSEHHLVIEGIQFTGTIKFVQLYYPCFFKCNFNYIYFSSYAAYMFGAQFVNCMIKYLFTYQYANNTTLINCVIWDSSISDGATKAYNSFIRFGNPIRKMSAYNCIISQTQSSYSISENSIAYNCIGIRASTSSSVFTGQNFGCMTVNSYSEVFETFDGGAFSYLEKYLLCWIFRYRWNRSGHLWRYCALQSKAKPHGGETLQCGQQIHCGWQIECGNRGLY